MARTNDGGVLVMPSDSSSSMANSVAVSVVVIGCLRSLGTLRFIVPLRDPMARQFFANVQK